MYWKLNSLWIRKKISMRCGAVLIVPIFLILPGYYESMVNQTVILFNFITSPNAYVDPCQFNLCMIAFFEPRG